ncbi:MAG: 2-dehydropantoate 2-reductase [Planctomycetota bacterium]|nr:MAG: 2-dehydropantoate 2-reductase [Planctomycetota bacterium]
MRIAIIGAGALGTFYGSRLQAAGHEVHLLARSDAAIGREQGFLCRSPLGELRIPGERVHARATDLPASEVVILATKTVENHLLAQLLPPALAANGHVLVLQNGLGVEAEAAAVVGNERVWGGLCFLCANKVAPAEVEHLAHGKVAFGHYCANGGSREPDTALQACAQAFADGGVEIELSADLVLARWRKLLWNIPYNGLCTVMDVDTAQLSRQQPGRALVEAIMQEVQAGAAKCGRHLSDAMRAAMIASTDDMGPYCPSMLLDRRCQRAMEVEHMFGNPLRAVRAAGGDMPQVDLLYRQLLTLDQLRLQA